MVPHWWPPDSRGVSYGLMSGAGRSCYRIYTQRANGAPVCVVGLLESCWRGRSPKDWLEGDWFEPESLAHVRGIVGRVGTSAALHVALYSNGLAIQLLGYRTDQEILNVVGSLHEAWVI